MKRVSVMKKRTVGLGLLGLLPALTLAACAGSAPPLAGPGLPSREVLGPSSSAGLDGTPMTVSMSARRAAVGGWNGQLESLAIQLAQQLRWDGRNRMKVAVLDFVEPHGRECTLGSPAAEDLTTNLFETNKFEIIERRMLERVLAENQATQTDLYDPEHVARLGGLLGADGIVTGTVSASLHGYAFNSRVILVESGGVASAAHVDLTRSDIDGRGSCGDGRVIIQAPPLASAMPGLTY